MIPTIEDDRLTDFDGQVKREDQVKVEHLKARVYHKALLRAPRVVVVRAANPHRKYAKNKIYGVATVDVDRDREVRVTFPHLTSVQSAERPGAIERVAFRTRLGTNAVEPI